MKDLKAATPQLWLTTGSLLFACNLVVTRKLFFLSITAVKKMFMFLFGRDIFQFMDLRLRGVVSRSSSISSILGPFTASFYGKMCDIWTKILRACSIIGIALGERRSCWGFVLIICSFHLHSKETPWHLPRLLCCGFMCRQCLHARIRHALERRRTHLISSWWSGCLCGTERLPVHDAWEGIFCSLARLQWVLQRTHPSRQPM